MVIRQSLSALPLLVATTARASVLNHIPELCLGPQATRHGKGQLKDYKVS